MGDKNLLAQDDIDALLGEMDSQQDIEEENPDQPKQKPVFKKCEMVSEDEMRSMLIRIKNRAILERDKGVRIIWNADSVYPMTSGFGMTIEGEKYVSLGVLNDIHLVIAPTQSIQSTV